MRSDSPVTMLWSMHTWQGIVEPLLRPGPEMDDARVGDWTRLRDILSGNDPRRLIKPLAASDRPSRLGAVSWTGGPYERFGISVVLCEGAGGIYTKEENLDSGAVLMKSIAQYYTGLRR